MRDEKNVPVCMPLLVIVRAREKKQVAPTWPTCGKSVGG